MSDEIEDELLFAFNQVVAKLNEKQNGDPSMNGDEIYAEHAKEERDERAEFLKQATPAFFFALTSELTRQLGILNLKLRTSADRVQLHMNQRMMQDLLLTSNVEATEWFNNGISLEVATAFSTGEIVETYRRPTTHPSDEKELRLYAGDDRSIRITSEQRSFSVPEYASHLIKRFLEERELLRNPPEDD